MINKKVKNKSLKYLAVGLFIFAMVANIQITLTDPFMFTSEMVLAQETSDTTDTCSDDSGCEGGCSATAYCYNWSGTKIGEVSCTGKQSCTSGYEYVECDGVKQECS